MTLLVEDPELLRRFRAGERSAQAMVFDHYAPRLAALLRGGFSAHSAGRAVRLPPLRSAFDLSNVVHESFARAFSPQARAHYDGRTPFLTYLVAIARNYLIDCGRGSAREQLVGAEEIEQRLAAGAGETLAPAASPAEEAADNEVRELLARFLQDRGELEQRFFRLRFEEENTQERAASLLGLTRIQVRRIEVRLKRDLLAFLQSHGYFEGVAPLRSGLLGVVLVALGLAWGLA